MDYNGNPVGGGMGAQFNMGGSPVPGDLFNRGANQIGQQIGVQPGGGGMFGQVLGRFQPRGMIPPAGARPQPGDMTGPYTRQRDPARYGNPRQLNPGQGPLQPGMPTPMPSPVVGRGKGGGGGKGGMPGPGGPQLIGGPEGRPIFGPGGGGPGYAMPFNFNDISGESPRDANGNYIDN
jgi:hypothetical protein